MAEKKGRDKAAPAESPKVPVLNVKAKTVREIQLSPAVFGGRVNGHLVYEAVKEHRAASRRGCL